MGRYAITAQFQPFSFQERIAPLKLYKEEYDKVNEGLALLGEEANAYSRYIDPNSESGKALAAYNEQLNQVANDLSANGLKAVSRNTLYNLRRNYNSTIKGINDAAKGLATMQEQYRALAMKDPTLMIGRMPTVDDLLKNPNAVPYTISGASLYEQAATTGASTDFRSPEEVQEAILQVAQANGIDALEDPSKAIAMIQKGINDGYNARRAKLADKQADYALKDYYATKLENLRNSHRMSQIAYSGMQQRLTKATPSAGNSSSRAVHTKSGTKYARYPKGTWRIVGDKEYLYGTDYGSPTDAAKKAIDESKAKVTRFENLTEENKLRVLDYLGIDRPTSLETLDSYLEDWMPYLNEFTYSQYIPQKRSEDAEFAITSRTIGRDTSGYSDGFEYTDNSDEEAFEAIGDYGK